MDREEWTSTVGEAKAKLKGPWRYKEKKFQRHDSIRRPDDDHIEIETCSQLE